MIKIKYDPDKLTPEQKEWWDNWVADAVEYTKEAIESWEKGEKIKFKDTHWGKLKDWLLKEVFNIKCAYCETIMDRAIYHAEHYRPKGEVKVKDIKNKNIAVTITDPLGAVIEHPGYFWLAYNWKNLLPSCQNCNTYGGKGVQFPALKGHVFLKKIEKDKLKDLREPYFESKKYPGFYYLSPEDLNDIEDPFLLHPYFDDPLKYLVFGIRGLVASLDNNEKGNNSIAVYNLRDERLRQGRQEAQENASRLVASYFGSIARTEALENEIKKDILSQIEQYRNGKAKYSAAANSYINARLKELNSFLDK